jgi:hypothetical protein
VQVEGLQEKKKGQGSQDAWQSARSAAQSKSQPGQMGHQVVAPSQVTLPRVEGQLLSVAEQLVVLLLPSQLTLLPSQQCAVAVQSAFCKPLPGRLAAGVGSGAPAANDAMNA